jgi:pilus assembly protein Flp/PilA
MKALMLKLWNDESRATMVEYGLMIALIAVVCIGAVRILGQNTQATFQTSSTRAGPDQPERLRVGRRHLHGAVPAAGGNAAVPESCTF